MLNYRFFRLLVTQQLIVSYLKQLYDIHIIIRSIPCDGTSTNIKSLTNLRCDFNITENNGLSSFASCFAHLSCPEIRDPCYMLKLAQNCLAEKHLVGDKGRISFKFIRKIN